MNPSLKVGERVTYTEDGIVSMLDGEVASWRFNEHSDRFEYGVKWSGDDEQEWYPRNRLYTEADRASEPSGNRGCGLALLLAMTTWPVPLIASFLIWGTK